MAKPLRALIIALVLCAVLLSSAWWLLREPNTTPSQPSQTAALVQRSPAEVARVEVENTFGRYTVQQENGAVSVHDIPAPLVNSDYVAMLLDECSVVSYEELVEQDAADLSAYGLSPPEATVTVAYTDGQTLQLLVGAVEPVSGGRYCKTAQSDDVVLLRHGRTVRFTMPVEKYIDFIIIPPNETTSALSALRDVTFSGTRLPEPVVIRAVLPDRPDILRQAVSFGATSHIIVQPALYETDPARMLAVADSLLGLLSEGIAAYNCTEETLRAYGFDQPALQVAFDYQTNKQAPVTHCVLKIVQQDGHYLATRNDEGVIYRIAPVDFLSVTYENLILRWFLSPLLTDVKTVTVTFDGIESVFALEQPDAKTLSVVCNGKPLDSEAFRKYYNLLVSAAADGGLQTGVELSAPPVMTVRYQYRDSEKPDDVMNLYAGEVRRVWVEVNGRWGFSMRENYLAVVKQATEAIRNQQSFLTQW